MSEMVSLPNDQHIHMWAWEDAPAWARALSPHGGDEDWVVVMARETEARWIEAGWMPGWLRATSAWGDPSRHIKGQFVVYIGAHA